MRLAFSVVIACLLLPACTVSGTGSAELKGPGTKPSTKASTTANASPGASPSAGTNAKASPGASPAARPGASPSAGTSSPAPSPGASPPVQAPPKLDGKFDLKIDGKALTVLRARLTSGSLNVPTPVAFSYAIEALIADPSGVGAAGTVTIFLAAPAGKSADTAANIAIRNYALLEPALATGNPVGQSGSASLEKVGERIAGTIRGEFVDAVGKGGKPFELAIDLPVGATPAFPALPAPKAAGGKFEVYATEPPSEATPRLDGAGGVFWPPSGGVAVKPLPGQAPAGPRAFRWTAAAGLVASALAADAPDFGFFTVSGKDGDLVTLANGGASVRDGKTGTEKRRLVSTLDDKLRQALLARFPSFAAQLPPAGSPASPRSLAVNPKDGAVWAADRLGVWGWKADGTAIGSSLHGMGAALESSEPTAIAVAPDGAVWLAFGESRRVAVIGADGALRKEFPVLETPMAIAFTPGGEALIWCLEALVRASAAGDVLARDPQDGGALGSVATDPTGALWAVLFNRDLELLRVAADGQTRTTFALEGEPGERPSVDLLAIADGELRLFGQTGVYRMPLAR